MFSLLKRGIQNLQVTPKQTEENWYTNYIVSGGTGCQERYKVAYKTLTAEIGKGPIVILHAQDDIMLDCVSKAWEETDAAGNAGSLIDSADEQYCLEPFFGMTERQIAAIIRRMGQKLGYSTGARLDDTVRGFCKICELYEIDIGLSSFLYFCEMSIAELDLCLAEKGDPARKNAIWQMLSTDDKEAYHVFRAVIFALSEAAESSGWKYNTSSTNCLGKRNLGTAKITFARAAAEETAAPVIRKAIALQRNRFSDYYGT